MEGFFAKLTRRRLKHGVFHSVVDLQAAINRFIAEHNEVEAKPFIWRAEPNVIIASRNRGFQVLGAPGCVSRGATGRPTGEYRSE